MDSSTHFAQLLHESSLPLDMKEWIIANLATIPPDKLEQIYADLQEEEAHIAKERLKSETSTQR